MQTKDSIISVLRISKEKTKLMKPVIDFIEQNLLKDIDPNRTRAVIEDDTFSVKIFTQEKDSIPIQLVLWLGEEERITFFIEDREIFDDYLKDATDVDREISFLRNLLSNEIEKVRYYRNGETKKIIYRYHLLGTDGISSQCEDKFTVKPSFFWSKNEKSEKVYMPWLK